MYCVRFEPPPDRPDEEPVRRPPFGEDPVPRRAGEPAPPDFDPDEEPFDPPDGGRDDRCFFGCLAMTGPSTVVRSADPTDVRRMPAVGWMRVPSVPMSRFATKDELLTDSRTARARLEELLDRIPPEAKVKEEVIDGLTTKDILAHRTEWGRMMLGWYAAAVAGDTPSVPAEGYSWRQLRS